METVVETGVKVAPKVVVMALLEENEEVRQVGPKVASKAKVEVAIKVEAYVEEA